VNEIALELFSALWTPNARHQARREAGAERAL
jgi:hypothetical protein